MIQLELTADEAVILREALVLYIYPANYGFLPRTRGPDGDRLDAIVLGQ